MDESPPREDAQPTDPDQTLRDRVAQEAEQARKEVGESFDALDSRLKEIEAKGRRVRKGYEQAHNRELRKLRQQQESSQGLGAGLTVAYIIGGTPIVFFGLGWAIDRYAIGSGTVWQSGLGLSGAFIGLLAGIWVLHRLQNR